MLLGGCAEALSYGFRLHMLPLQSQESNKLLSKAIQSTRVKVDPLVSWVSLQTCRLPGMSLCWLQEEFKHVAHVQAHKYTSISISVWWISCWMREVKRHTSLRSPQTSSVLTSAVYWQRKDFSQFKKKKNPTFCQICCVTVTLCYIYGMDLRLKEILQSKKI